MRIYSPGEKCLGKGDFVANKPYEKFKELGAHALSNEELLAIILRTGTNNKPALKIAEEILNTKMRVHDEMGRCLVVAQKYLKEDNNQGIPENIVESWQRAVAMLKYNNDTPDEDMLLQICKTCEFMKLDFIKTGELPKQRAVAYILTCAVRECLTNAVRYAGATKLYADFTETESEATVTIANNGKPPKGEIIKGGGLSTLHRRIERAGGIMNIQSFPRFKMTVIVPKVKEDVL